MKRLAMLLALVILAPAHAQEGVQNAIDGMRANVPPATYVVWFKPLSGGYNSVRTWVDKKTCVPLKADFRVGETVRKRLIASPSALQQSGNYWYLSEVEMRDLLEGTKTVMITGKVTG